MEHNPKNDPKRWCADDPILYLLLLDQAQQAGRISGILSMHIETTGETLQFASMDALMQYLFDEYQAQEGKKGSADFDEAS